MTTPPAVLGRRDSAVYLAISIRKLDSLVEQGRIKRIKIDAKTVFAVDELNRFIEKQKEDRDDESSKG